MYLIFAWVLLGVTALSRLAWYSTTTSDYIYFVQVWFNTLRDHAGLSAFTTVFADYAPAYLYLLKLLTFIPVSSLVSSKTLSLFFDIAIALIICYLLYRTRPAEYHGQKLFFVFALVLALPTMALNSSLWAQSDAIYTAFIVASFYFIVKDKPLPAALLFGVALCFKIQAIFFLPVLVGYLFRSLRTSFYLLLTPVIFALSIVPAWLGGGSFVDWFFIYLKQAGEYPYLSVSAQSIFAFAQPLNFSPGLQNVLFWVGVTAATLLALFVVWRVRNARPDPARLYAYATELALLALTSTLFLPYLLPRMHERYFYLADIFALIYALYVPRRWHIPALVVFTSLLSYMPFLSSQIDFLAPFKIVDLRFPAAVLLIVIGVVGLDLIRTNYYRKRIEAA